MSCGAAVDVPGIRPITTRDPKVSGTGSPAWEAVGAAGIREHGPIAQQGGHSVNPRSSQSAGHPPTSKPLARATDSGSEPPAPARTKTNASFAQPGAGRATAMTQKV